MWKYNGKIYQTRRELTELFGWSTTKWNKKIEENKIIKIKNEDNSNDNNQQHTT